jgi:hypothetical protein
MGILKFVTCIDTQTVLYTCQLCTHLVLSLLDLELQSGSEQSPKASVKPLMDAKSHQGPSVKDVKTPRTPGRFLDDRHGGSSNESGDVIFVRVEWQGDPVVNIRVQVVVCLCCCVCARIHGARARPPPVRLCPTLPTSPVAVSGCATTRASKCAWPNMEVNYVHLVGRANLRTHF